MKAIITSQNRRLVKSLVLSLIAGLTLTGTVLNAPQAVARVFGIPIDVDPRSAIVPGQPLPVAVHLTEASNITITSSPAGYVSYSGYANANATVNATTSPNASGIVTIYLTTPGSQAVSAMVETSQQGGPPGQP